MLHPMTAYEVANSRYEEMRRESEKMHHLRRVGFVAESTWRKRRMGLVRLLSQFF